MAVVATMRCDTKSIPPDWASGVGVPAEVRLTPVADENEEYKDYFDATPYGKCMLGLLNEVALEQFEPGTIYRVTFEKVGS